MPITSFDLQHVENNFLNKIAELEAKLARLERHFVSLDVNSFLTLPSGLQVGAGLLSIGEAIHTTIVNDIITVTGSNYMVDTEAGAANDDIDTIEGGIDGALLILRAESDGRTVHVRRGVAGADNILLGVADRELNNVWDRLLLIYDGDLSLWVEIAFADNGV